jgi:hypothetical protein
LHPVWPRLCRLLSPSLNPRVVTIEAGYPRSLETGTTRRSAIRQPSPAELASVARCLTATTAVPNRPAIPTRACLGGSVPHGSLSASSSRQASTETSSDGERQTGAQGEVAVRQASSETSSDGELQTGAQGEVAVRQAPTETSSDGERQTGAQGEVAVRQASTETSSDGELQTGAQGEVAIRRASTETSSGGGRQTRARGACSWYAGFRRGKLRCCIPGSARGGGRGPANRRPARVALRGIAPTSHAQPAFHDSRQWAVRPDVACATGPCGGLPTTCSPPHATSRGASRTASSHACRRP